jgi:excisionase family DNA binding protein
MLPRANASSDQLLERVLRKEDGAWRELVRANEPALRALFHEEMSPTDVDDVIGETWLRILESDLRRLRRFEITRPATLDAWLAMQASQVAHELRSKRGPKMVSLDSIAEIADTRKPPEPAPKLMRVEEVASRWEINVKTIYAMVQRGELLAVRLGRVLRIPRSVVESFEQGRAVSGGK